MKQCFFLAILLHFTFSSAQIIQPTSYTLKLSYDNAGNQIKRELICVGLDCLGIEQSQSTNSLRQNNLTKSSEYPELSYYPNPVKEELYVQWKKEKEIVTGIMVYSLSSQLVKTYSNLSGVNNVSVAFSGLPDGMYNLVLSYSSGEQKTLKIIKK